MNYLELCQRVRTECAIPGNGPVSVENQTGILLDVIRWVNLAYEDVQQDSADWFFRLGSKSFSSIANTNTYTSEMSDVLKIRPDTVSLYETVADEGRLTFLPYLDFKNTYLIGTEQTGKPIHYTVNRSNELMLGPTPDGVYTVRLGYTKTLDSLSVNEDIPILPVDYHAAIVWKACMYYAGYEEAQAQAILFEKYYKAVYNRMYSEQREGIELGQGALA